MTGTWAFRFKSASGSPWVQRLIVWGSLLVLYEVAARAAGPFFLPTLEAIASGFVDLVVDGQLLTITDSLQQLIVGYLIACLVGITLGLLIGRLPIVDQGVGLYVRILLVSPLSALLPVITILVGFEFAFRVTIVFLFCFFFIVLNTASGARAVPRAQLEMASSFGASRYRRFVSVVLPSSLPYIFSGLRLGLANAFSGMVIAELWVGHDLGLLISAASFNRNLPRLFALIVIVTLLATVSAAALKRIGGRLAPWGPEQA
jgi:ABC-type nitrate/sulfonate/bicarbonate transport system permease component